jgi:hypothetical protein
MHPGSLVLWGCWSTTWDSTSITLVVRKWWPYSFHFNRGNRKVRWAGTTVMLFLVRNSQLKKEVWNDALSWCNSQFFCSQSLVQSVRIFSLGCRKAVVCRINCLVCQDNSLRTIPLMWKKWWAFSWLCSSSVSPFSISVILDFPCTAHAFFPEHLSNH